MRKIAFFDIDGTLTSEIDGSIQQSAVEAIRTARESRIDLHFEACDCMCFTSPETLRHDWAKQYYQYLTKTYTMPKSIYEPGFAADKFVIWLSEIDKPLLIQIDYRVFCFNCTGPCITF